MGMMEGDSKTDTRDIPVYDYLDRKQKEKDKGFMAIDHSGMLNSLYDGLKTGFVSFEGDMQPVVIARIANWLATTLLRHKFKTRQLLKTYRLKKSTLNLQIIGSPTLVHAQTIYIAERDRTKTLTEAFNLLRRRRKRYTDVDRECLILLTSRMFNTGQKDWGIDAGPHQDGWDPYKETRDETDRSEANPDDINSSQSSSVRTVATLLATVRVLTCFIRRYLSLSKKD